MAAVNPAIVLVELGDKACSATRPAVVHHLSEYVGSVSGVGRVDADADGDAHCSCSLVDVPGSVMRVPATGAWRIKCDAFLQRGAAVVSGTSSTSMSLLEVLTKRAIMLETHVRDPAGTPATDAARAAFPNETEEERARNDPGHLLFAHDDGLGVMAYRFTLVSRGRGGKRFMVFLVLHPSETELRAAMVSFLSACRYLAALFIACSHRVVSKWCSGTTNDARQSACDAKTCDPLPIVLRNFDGEDELAAAARASSSGGSNAMCCAAPTASFGCGTGVGGLGGASGMGQAVASFSAPVPSEHGVLAHRTATPLAGAHSPNGTTTNGIDSNSRAGSYVSFADCSPTYEPPLCSKGGAMAPCRQKTPVTPLFQDLVDPVATAAEKQHFHSYLHSFFAELLERLVVGHQCALDVDAWTRRIGYHARCAASAARNPVFLQKELQLHRASCGGASSAEPPSSPHIGTASSTTARAVVGVTSELRGTALAGLWPLMRRSPLSAVKLLLDSIARRVEARGDVAVLLDALFSGKRIVVTADAAAASGGGDLLANDVAISLAALLPERLPVVSLGVADYPQEALSAHIVTLSRCFGERCAALASKRRGSDAATTADAPTLLDEAVVCVRVTLARRGDNCNANGSAEGDSACDVPVVACVETLRDTDDVSKLAAPSGAFCAAAGLTPAGKQPSRSDGRIPSFGVSRAVLQRLVASANGDCCVAATAPLVRWIIAEHTARARIVHNEWTATTAARIASLADKQQHQQHQCGKQPPSAQAQRAPAAAGSARKESSASAAEMAASGGFMACMWARHYQQEDEENAQRSKQQASRPAATIPPIEQDLTDAVNATAFPHEDREIYKYLGRVLAKGSRS